MKDNNTLKEKGLFENPYKKFEAFGEERLSDEELLAIILRTGKKDLSALELSRKLLSENQNGILNLSSLSFDDMRKLPGIGKVKAMELKCVFELAKRITCTVYKKSMSVFSPESMARVYMEGLRHENREKLLVAMFDAKGRFMGDEILTVGTFSKTIISPRDVFSAALKKNAACFVMLHNHPSGVPKPSDDDIRITYDIGTLGDVMQCRLLDHIIIGDNTYFSFLENNLIKTK